MRATIQVFLLFTMLSGAAFANSKLGSRPTVPGARFEVVNCDDGVYRGSDGWARCWLWNDLNLAWEQRTVYCPQVGCDQKLPPDDGDDKQYEMY